MFIFCLLSVLPLFYLLLIPCVRRGVGDQPLAQGVPLETGCSFILWARAVISPSSDLSSPFCGKLPWSLISSSPCALSHLGMNSQPEPFARSHHYMQHQICYHSIGLVREALVASCMASWLPLLRPPVFGGFPPTPLPLGGVGNGRQPWFELGHRSKHGDSHSLLYENSELRFSVGVTPSQGMPCDWSPFPSDYILLNPWVQKFLTLRPTPFWPQKNLCNLGKKQVVSEKPQLTIDLVLA